MYMYMYVYIYIHIVYVWMDGFLFCEIHLCFTLCADRLKIRQNGLLTSWYVFFVFVRIFIWNSLSTLVLKSWNWFPVVFRRKWMHGKRCFSFILFYLLLFICQRLELHRFASTWFRTISVICVDFICLLMLTLVDCRLTKKQRWSVLCVLLIFIKKLELPKIESLSKLLQLGRVFKQQKN